MSGLIQSKRENKSVTSRTEVLLRHTALELQGVEMSQFQQTYPRIEDSRIFKSSSLVMFLTEDKKALNPIPGQQKPSLSMAVSITDAILGTYSSSCPSADPTRDCNVR